MLIFETINRYAKDLVVRRNKAKLEIRMSIPFPDKSHRFFLTGENLFRQEKEHLHPCRRQEGDPLHDLGN